MLKSSVGSIWETHVRQVLKRKDRRSLCQGHPELGSGSDRRAMHCLLPRCDFDFVSFDVGWWYSKHMVLKLTGHCMVPSYLYCPQPFDQIALQAKGQSWGTGAKPQSVRPLEWLGRQWGTCALSSLLLPFEGSRRAPFSQGCVHFGHQLLLNWFDCCHFGILWDLWKSNKIGMFERFPKVYIYIYNLIVLWIGKRTKPKYERVAPYGKTVKTKWVSDSTHSITLFL